MSVLAYYAACYLLILFVVIQHEKLCVIDYTIAVSSRIPQHINPKANLFQSSWVALTSVLEGEPCRRGR